MRPWRLAESLIVLRGQVNANWPNRDKRSDGSIGDAAHAARVSDHNPNSAGVVTAIDIDSDLSPTQNVSILVDELFRSKDPRIKYLIFNRQITERDSHGIIFGWIPYHGTDPHTGHLHISVKSDPKLYDDARRWEI